MKSFYFSAQPPFIPEVTGESDTSNFDIDETDLRPNDAMPPISHSAFTGQHLPFVGFTFSRNR